LNKLFAVFLFVYVFCGSRCKQKGMSYAFENRRALCSGEGGHPALKRPAGNVRLPSSCLFQHVHEFTRFRNGQQPSCLDYVFTSEDNVLQDLQYQSPLGKNDHVVLTWKTTVHADELNSYLKK